MALYHSNTKVTKISGKVPKYKMLFLSQKCFLPGKYFQQQQHQARTMAPTCHPRTQRTGAGGFLRVSRLHGLHNKILSWKRKQTEANNEDLWCHLPIYFCSNAEMSRWATSEKQQLQRQMEKIEQNIRYLFKVPRHAILYFIKMCAASWNTDSHINSQLELEHSPFILGRENH